jgi:drug/metabolite transporter (DMT)-like permease
MTSKPSTARLVAVYASLLVLTVIWGNAFVAIRHGVQFMAAIELAAARFLPVVVIYGSWLLLKDRAGAWQMLRQDGRQILFMALAGVTTYHIALNMGQRRVPAGTASLIVAFSPAVAAALSAIFLRERLTPLRLAGLAISFAGIVVIVMLGQGLDAPRTLEDLIHYALVLLAACVWGSYSVVGQSLLRRYPQMRVMAMSLTLGGLPLVALAPLDLWPRFAAFPLSVWVAVIFLALLCTVLAYIIWLNGIQSLGAARTASFNYLIPLVAVVSGWLLLGERITWGQAMGGALVVSGVIAINRR